MVKLITLAFVLLSIVQPTLLAKGMAEAPDLPKVLIIGDSISIGYTAYVQKALEGKAVVKHHEGNAGPTIRAVANIEKWLGGTQWDVIHFNWGLWDMYGWQYAQEDRSPLMYEKRLEALVGRLQRTGAVLIWATTTPVCPVPEKTMRRRFKTEVKITSSVEKQYQDAALRVMKKHRIQVNDLHAIMAPKLKQYALGPDDVHFTKEGYKKLGQQVARSIEKNLVAEQKSPPKANTLAE